MKRNALVTAALTLVAGVGVQASVAQTFTPQRPLEFMVHTGPGAGSDLFARNIAGILEKSKLVPQRVQVLNKPGGGGLVAMSFLSEKKGEPHLVGFFTSVWYVYPLIRREGKITMKELTPIARLVLEPSVLTVRSDSPFMTARDFVEAARKAPGKLKQGGGSVSGRDNNTRLMMQKATGARWQFISFPSGGERLAALLGGHIDAYIMEPAEALEQIRAGKIRVIATLMKKRLLSFPNVPTLQEQGIDVPELPLPRGIVGPPNMPAHVKAYWENLLANMVKLPEWQDYLKKDLLEDGFMVGADLVKFTDQFTEQMRTLLRDGGVPVLR